MSNLSFCQLLFFSIVIFRVRLSIRTKTMYLNWLSIKIIIIDLIEDTFGGSRTRCVMLAGSQVDKWDGVRKYNLGAIKGASARQKSNEILFYADADRAVDGISWPFYLNDENNIFNTISRTENEENPWWEALLDVEYEINDVIIHNIQDSAFIGDLSDFTVSIHNNYDSSLGPNNDLKILWNQTFKVDEPFDKYHVVVPHINGKRVRITLNKKASLQLAEVEVMGRKTSETQKVRIPIGDLFAGRRSDVNYMSFIQDNDNDNLVGQSEFANIRVVTEEPKIVVSCILLVQLISCFNSIIYLFSYKLFLDESVEE